jgi:hypothetical protein
MGEIVDRLVEQHFAQAPADDHAQHPVEQHVVEVLLGPALGLDVGLGPDAHAPQDDEQGKGEHVHDPVPVDGQGTDVEGDGVRIRMDEHGGWFLSDSSIVPESP